MNAWLEKVKKIKVKINCIKFFKFSRAFVICKKNKIITPIVKVISFDSKRKQSHEVTKDQINKAVSLKFKCDKLFTRRGSDRMNDPQNTKNRIKIRRNRKRKGIKLAKFLDYADFWTSTKELEQKVRGLHNTLFLFGGEIKFNVEFRIKNIKLLLSERTIF